MGGRSRSRDEKRSRSRSRGKRDRSRSRDRDRSRGRGRKDDKVEDDDKFEAGRQVIVKGLQKNPEKNGALGSLKKFNLEKGRWVVQLGSGDVNLKEENLELIPDNSDVINEKEEPPTAKIYITSLPAETTDKDLIEFFGSMGTIAKEKPKGVRNPGHEESWPYAVKLYKPGRKDGDACVTYQDPYAAKAAIKTFNRYKFKGSKIGVAYAGQGMKYEAKELTLPWHMRPENQGKMQGEEGGGGKPAPRPGDWKCPGCGADVFASKNECFKCGGLKPAGGGGGGGGKGKGKG